MSKFAVFWPQLQLFYFRALLPKIDGKSPTVLLLMCKSIHRPTLMVTSLTAVLQVWQGV